MQNYNIFLSLGSNLGNKKHNIESALSLLGEKCTVVKVSSFYETEPVGFTEQDWFLNCAVEITTKLSPSELLLFCKEIEKKLGRVKNFQNGPRVIDIDILFYGNEIINSKDLIIPHPRLHERRFVLEPLQEIAGEFVDPLLKKNVSRLCNKLNSTDEVVLCND